LAKSKFQLPPLMATATAGLNAVVALKTDRKASNAAVLASRVAQVQIARPVIVTVFGHRRSSRWPLDYAGSTSLSNTTVNDDKRAEAINVSARNCRLQVAPKVVSESKQTSLSMASHDSLQL